MATSRSPGGPAGAAKLPEAAVTRLAARAGLPAGEVAAWARSLQVAAGDPAAAGQLGADSGYQAAAHALVRFLAAGQGFLQRLPKGARGSAAERAARESVFGLMNDARAGFLRRHASHLYDDLTAGRTRFLRLGDLLATAAGRIPGLVPSTGELAAERARPLPDKEGIEFAQALLAAHVLAVPAAGQHLITAMLRPTREAAQRLAEFRQTGLVDLGLVRVHRHGRAGVLELRNPRYLNAEDDLTLGPAECAADLILLDPDLEVGVIRGGIVNHPKYPGVRVFGSGLNLTRLYWGQVGYLFFLLRDLGFVNKIYRGLDLGGESAGDPASEGTREKVWIAAVERFAVGGACQLLHVVDHVIATRGSRLFLPARREGIIPGASSLRLPRFVGDRAARQAIFSGREWTAGEPDAALLVDEAVADKELDRALAARVAALAGSGLVNAAANRRALREGQEPLEVFRSYMAAFALEQARCYLSPALVRNLEAHWNARQRHP
jgi:thioesterase DpgC